MKMNFYQSARISKKDHILSPFEVYPIKCIKFRTWDWDTEKRTNHNYFQQVLKKFDGYYQALGRNQQEDMQFELVKAHKLLALEEVK